jgi:hypothetical protein
MGICGQRKLFVQACSEALNICEQAFSMMKLNKSIQRKRQADGKLTSIVGPATTSATTDLHRLASAVRASGHVNELCSG